MKSLEQIAAELQGYDPQSVRADQVQAFLARLVTPVNEVEQVSVFQSLGRVLAQDVLSPVSVPPHDNSAMDGYAFDGRDLQDGRALALRVVGTAYAGQAWQGQVGPGECVKIMTGAIMPAGLDTVVPQEFTRTEGEVIHVPAGLLQRGENRRLLGEDLMAGRAALAAGTRIGPAACGLLASLGVATVPVVRRLRVAYFSTGDEILSIGEAPREGAVYDSNRYTVFGLLTRLGCDVLDLGVMRDEPALLEAAFRRAAGEADVVITSGGVSVGEADHTKAMMKRLGDVAFWRIAMRPGRPMAVGHVLTEKLATPQHVAAVSSYEKKSNPPSPGAVLFGLPGNPVAVMVTFLAFVRPALLRMMGSTRTAPPLLRATSTEAIRKKPGRTEYQRGTVSRDTQGQWVVQIIGNQGSGVLRSMVEGNGLIVLHHGQGHVAAGDWVDVLVFDGVI